MDAADRTRVLRASTALARAARPIRVLSHLAWPLQARADFLATGASALPVVDYPPFDASRYREQLAEARADIYPDQGGVDQWLAATADQVETTVAMLSAAGTPDFSVHATALYGAPTLPLPRTSVTPQDLANSILDVLGQLSELELGLTPPPDVTADEVADHLVAGLALVFGDDAPPVTIVDDLSANAAASARGIRVRRDALFTDRDADQLLQHEAYIHVATALNGRRQPLEILGVGHPGTTRAQEGLAVFAELASGFAELDRMRRLADRVTAIQMVVDGADFIELYRWFLERTPTREQAYESARRAMRGGPLTGGAPFTKDVVYLYGLMEVANVVRTAFAAGRIDVLRLLFVGKLPVAAIPALAECAAAGLVVRPSFVPPWVADPRGILSLLTLSTFLARIDLPSMVTTAEELLVSSPVVDFRDLSAVTPPDELVG